MKIKSEYQIIKFFFFSLTQDIPRQPNLWTFGPKVGGYLIRKRTNPWTLTKLPTSLTTKIVKFLETESIKDCHHSSNSNPKNGKVLSRLPPYILSLVHRNSFLLSL